jgi:hypothetical protein
VTDLSITLLTPPLEFGVGCAMASARFGRAKERGRAAWTVVGADGAKLAIRFGCHFLRVILFLRVVPVLGTLEYTEEFGSSL